MTKYTATYKNRSCTKKAATKAKVDVINAKMADTCDKALSKEKAKEERRERRAGFAKKRGAKCAG